MAIDDDAQARVVGDAEVARAGFEELPLLAAMTEGPEHRFVAVNAAYRRLVGKPVLLGRTIREVFPEVEGQRIFDLVDDAYATGQVRNAREWRVQIDTDGSGVPRDLYLNITAIPRREAGGAVHGVLYTVEEITEQILKRQAAEREAAEAKRRYRDAREVVADLQEALLPHALPVLPTARIAARYLVAAEDQSAGGDWFDAVPFPDGRVALVVGDVVGHGVLASAAMAQLRAVLNHLLLTEHELATVIARADRFARSVPALRAATLAVVVLDQGSGELTYSLCGHPVPLVIAADGATRYLPETGAGPLTTGHLADSAHATLGEGETVLLYSDGLIERPGHTLAEGMAELASVASDAAAKRTYPVGAAPTAAERVCQLTVELLTRGGYSDDVTALSVQRLPASIAPLTMELPGRYESLAEVRDAFTSWLDGLDAVEDDRIALELAASEAVTNSIEHAYGERKGTVCFDAVLQQDGYLECRVTDQGSWQEPAPGESTRGRGLMLMEQMLDELRVRHPPQQAGQTVGARGTVVTLRHRLHRPAMLASDTAPTPAPLTAVPFATETAGSVVRVQGPVDATTVAKFARDLAAASRGGVRTLTVDLGEVTHLASAGVRALHETREQLEANGRSLTLLAPAGSAAQVVLDLVRLPYHEPAAGGA